LSLSPEDGLLVLCVHGSKELWSKLQWIVDVAGYVRAHPQLDWTDVVRQAEAQGCRRMLAVGLMLGQSLLDAAVPANVLEDLSTDRAAATLSELFARMLFEGTFETPSVYCLSLLRLRLRERLGDSWRYVWRTITTPRIQHYEMVSLPDWAFAGYYPLKVLHDYAALPVWRVGKFLIRRWLQGFG
jgi:hypothetical protein